MPIDAVARQFGVRASTLRYYESRGLIAPASQHGGRRWYGPSEVRRLAIILFWQRSGLFSLDAIGEILDRSQPGGQWRETVRTHVKELQQRIEHLRRAEAFVSQSLECAHHECLDDCPDYEALIWQSVGRPQASEDIVPMSRAVRVGLNSQDRDPTGSAHSRATSRKDAAGEPDHG
ncbi:MerR family transcriptional regulator [Nocardia sp. NPDC050408]|uniref:MerR family transcriptional regulator n=1 Tax=Nocardia sp. NPDC050408 TaxID=3364319 RepID=UPI00378E1BAC